MAFKPLPSGSEILHSEERVKVAIGPSPTFMGLPREIRVVILELALGLTIEPFAKIGDEDVARAVGGSFPIEDRSPPVLDIITSTSDRPFSWQYYPGSLISRHITPAARFSNFMAAADTARNQPLLDELCDIFPYFEKCLEQELEECNTIITSVHTFHTGLKDCRRSSCPTWTKYFCQIRRCLQVGAFSKEGRARFSRTSGAIQVPLRHLAEEEKATPHVVPTCGKKRNWQGEEVTENPAPAVPMDIGTIFDACRVRV